MNDTFLWNPFRWNCKIAPFWPPKRSRSSHPQPPPPPRFDSIRIYYSVGSPLPPSPASIPPSLPHSLTHTINQSTTISLTHSFIHSPTQSTNQSLSLTHPLTHSLSHPIDHSLLTLSHTVNKTTIYVHMISHADTTRDFAYKDTHTTQFNNFHIQVWSDFTLSPIVLACQFSAQPLPDCVTVIGPVNAV